MDNHEGCCNRASERRVGQFYPHVLLCVSLLQLLQPHAMLTSGQLSSTEYLCKFLKLKTNKKAKSKFKTWLWGGGKERRKDTRRKEKWGWGRQHKSNDGEREIDT